MTLPLCFDILNLDYFNNLVIEINNSESAVDLQALVDKVYADISLLESTIQSQIDSLTPMNALLSIPAANPAAIVTWITDFINGVLTPLLLPLNSLAGQITALTAQVAILTAAIEAASIRLGVTITIPSISIVCTL